MFDREHPFQNFVMRYLSKTYDPELVSDPLTLHLLKFNYFMNCLENDHRAAGLGHRVPVILLDE